MARCHRDKVRAVKQLDCKPLLLPSRDKMNNLCRNKHWNINRQLKGQIGVYNGRPKTTHLLQKRS